MFDILFKGECQPQQDVETVKQNMAQLFKISVDKAEGLFNGQSLTLKRGLEKEIASKYIKAITRAGAIAYAVESGTDSDTPGSTPVSDAAESAAAQPAARVAEPEQTAAGQDSNTAQQVSGKTAPEPEPQSEPESEQGQQNKHISALEAELDPPGITLLEYERVQSPNIDTTGMSLSEPGETLAEAANIADADIDTGHLSLSDSGSDMSDK